MRRIATVSALAALAVGLPLLEAEAGNGCCRHGRRAALHYAPPPPPPSAWYNAPSRYYGVTANPWFAWRAYYDAQADVSFARRALRGSYYTAAGRAIPSRYFGPPTNYYAERYSLEPYSYFNCPLARRGDGICPDPDFFKP